MPNDHSDADYDAACLDRLGELDRARPVLDGSPGSCRARRTPARLRRGAGDRAPAGEHDWVSGARIDSYHTVWFELHEDLLRMLGREREEQT